MGKIDKDQFEKFLEKNRPTEEPSDNVFKRLQNEASWNCAPTKAWPGRTALLTTALICITIAIIITSASQKSSPTPELKPEPTNVRPVINRQIDVIAINSLPETGVYRFMTNRSDDFKLSFSADISDQLKLGDTLAMSEVWN